MKNLKHAGAIESRHKKLTLREKLNLSMINNIRKKMGLSIIVFFIAIILILPGCDMIIESPDYEWAEIDNYYYEKYNLSSLSSSKEVYEWAEKNINYKNDLSVNDHWNYANDTIEKMAGDCEDMAILILAIYNKNFGYKGQLLIGNMTENSIIVNHAIAYVNGLYCGNLRYTFDVIYFDNIGSAIFKNNNL